MIFFYFFFDARGEGRESRNDAEIVRNVWLLGIVPFLVGVGLLINGFFISRRLVKLKEQLARPAMSAANASSNCESKRFGRQNNRSTDR